MRTEASSTDNYNGCKHQHCKERASFGRLAVDGSFHSCFLSLSERSPWFIVHLNGYHPIALVHVALGEADRRRLKNIYIGNTLHQKKGSPQGEWLISPFARMKTRQTPLSSRDRAGPLEKRFGCDKDSCHNRK